MYPEKIYDLEGTSYRTWNNVPQRDIACYEWVANEEPHFPLPKEAEPADDIPKGILTTHEWKSEQVYPGVSGNYELYVPQQYCGQEAALMVFLDGSAQFIRNAMTPNVLDTMIHNGDLPVSIAVFMNPGAPGPGLPRFGGSGHRCVEYNEIDDRYVTFLDQEILPEIRSKYNITSDPEKSMIFGISASGNAAFTAAWHRPDLFHKVGTFVGSFVDICGGDRFPSLIRQAPKKPLKIFLQSGEHDLNMCFGNWPLANQTMASALEYKGYDYKLVIGPGGHSMRYGASILPDTLRWLWE